MAMNNSSLPTSFSAEYGKMIRLDKKSTIFPARPSQRQQIQLSPLDLQTLLLNYSQKALLYETPTENFPSAVEFLSKSLSEVLVNFYPLAGRLMTSSSDGAIYIDCNDSGAQFIEAAADDISIADLTTADVTPAVEQLFALNGAVNIGGHRLPLLAVQVTKLRDGISVGCTINHAVVDGTSFWHFVNSWAELCRENGKAIAVKPMHDRSVLSTAGAAVRLGLDPDGHMPWFCDPLLRRKLFHFSKHTVRGLKERINRDSPVVISSFQALCSHLWQAVTRARGLVSDEPATFRLSVDCRRRLVPPLPSFYFGNVVQSIAVTVTAEELTSSSGIWLLHDLIEGHRDEIIREKMEKWKSNPVLHRFDMVEKNCVLVGSSPRFSMYENDFGWGEAVAVRSGCGNHFDGKVTAYPGKEGVGSVDLEICLPPNVMEVLENDKGFLHPLL